MQHRSMAFLGTGALLLSTAESYADLGDQLSKLMAEDGEVGDRFGFSVAMSGATAIVGAYLDDDNGPDSGSAYLFDTKTGQQIAKLLAEDGAVLDRFGYAVAISGTTAIVGAYWDDDNGTNSGSAYLFDTTTGDQIAKLLPKDGSAGDRFGFSVGIIGTTAIVGAYWDDDFGTSSGSAYLFDTTTGDQIAKLLPKDGSGGDRFGFAVAISSNTAIVGGYHNDDNGPNSGSAYLFDTTTGDQIAKLLPIDGAQADEFGYSVAIRGTTAIIGSRLDDDSGNNSGSAYLFRSTTGEQIAKLLPNNNSEDDNFGVSVALSGPNAIVGASTDDDNGIDSGSAYLFDKDSGCKIVVIRPDDGEAGDEFGFAVAISGGTALVGAPLDDDNAIDAGSAYLFEATGTSSCPWDLDDNTVVGITDFLFLLASWGPCKGCCPADFEGTGNVGITDFLALLANWGPCP